MADTENAFEITGGAYIDLNTLTGIAAGTELTLQNVGGANDIIEVAVSASQPATSFRGLRLEQNQFYGVAAGENTVWCRYIRIDRADVGTRKTYLQVQI